MSKFPWIVAPKREVSHKPTGTLFRVAEQRGKGGRIETFKRSPTIPPTAARAAAVVFELDDGLV